MFKNLIGALGAEQIILIVLLAVMVVVLIVLPMFTNRRRNKAVNELYNSIVPGDVIKTVGGVIGEVKEVRQLTPVDKQIVLETGADGSKTTMVFDIQAVYQVLNKVNAPAPAPAPNEAPAADGADAAVAAKEPDTTAAETAGTAAAADESEKEKK